MPLPVPSPLRTSPDPAGASANPIESVENVESDDPTSPAPGFFPQNPTPSAQRSALAHLPPDPGSQAPEPGCVSSPPADYTAAQQTLLDALAAGASKSDAARTAHVHRDTANRWEHNVPGYRNAVLAAQQEYRQRLASQLRRVSVTALDQLESLLAAPETPPSVSLRAIQLTLTRPRFPDKEWALPENVNSPELQQLQQHFDFLEADYRAGLHEDHLRREHARAGRVEREAASFPGAANQPSTAGQSSTAPQNRSATSAKSVQSVQSGHPTDPKHSSNRVGNVESVESPTTETDTHAQPPRNAPCPCGSGLKHKRCCGKSAPPQLHQPHCNQEAAA